MDFNSPIKLETIQKLGAFYRTHYQDWQIRVLRDWCEAGTTFMREIVHEEHGAVLVYAKVEVPAETFYRFQLELQDLGNQSIGDHFLFVKEGVRRDPFEIFQGEGPYLLARRSRFWVEGFPLTITEYFTEAGLQCLQD